MRATLRRESGMEDDLFDELESEAAATPKKPPPSLDQIRGMGAEASRIQTEIEKLDERLSELKTRRYKLLMEEMPAVMTEAKVPSITVEGRTFECKSYYKANIAAKDPPEKREAAFAWVEEVGGGDIIANTVTVAFPKEFHEDAAEFARETRTRFHNKPSIEVAEEKEVPWGRLTSWLRDYVETPPVRGEEKKPVPLELLNATVGRIVKIKGVREK